MGITDQSKFFIVFLLSLAVFAHADPPVGGYKLVFDEEFSGTGDYTPHDINSGYGPLLGGQKWISHTPSHKDFTVGQFTSSACVQWNNHLIISAFQKPVGKWNAGLISSMDSYGNGFSQALGYWECRMNVPYEKPKITQANGSWDAFWLLGADSIPNKINYSEVDIVENYGAESDLMWSTVHVWGTNGAQLSVAGPHPVRGTAMYPGTWHVFGCLINSDLIHFYLDGVEVWRATTPAPAKNPLFCMVDLALGGGWPITTLGAQMDVDYVKCWAPPD